MVLGTYACTVRLGNTITGKSLLSDTLRGYIGAAHAVLEVLQNRVINIYDAHSGSKLPHLHPYLRDQIQMCVNWEEKSRKKQPYSDEMFQWLFDELHGTTSSEVAFLGLQWAVYDWQRLGIFTGSRVSEYAQTKLKKGHAFQTVPMNPAAGQWAGMPLAFIRSDFVFYNSSLVIIPHSDVYTAHATGNIAFLEICFRFDKSRHNFTRRKYCCTGHKIYDPVDAAISILRRADYLQVPFNEPIGVVSNLSPSVATPYRFLRDSHITKIMRAACCGAHDENHYLRQNIDCIVPHSNRVTAAVCLQNGGAHNDEIAFQLRWHPSSVPIYLRHCFKTVGTVLEKVVAGVLRTPIS